MRHLALVLLILAGNYAGLDPRAMIWNPALEEYIQSKCHNHGGWTWISPVAQKAKCSDEYQFNYPLKDVEEWKTKHRSYEYH